MTARDDFRFFHPLRVRWNECDAQGIVFNANYFVYYDIAVWEWTRALGYRRYLEAPEFVTAHAECDFHAPALFDDEIAIGMRAARLGGKSMDIAAAIFRGGALLNSGKLTYVHVRQGTKEPAPLGVDFVARVRAFEKVAPASAPRA